MIEVSGDQMQSKIPCSAIDLEANKRIIHSLLQIATQYGDTLTWDKHPKEYEEIEKIVLAQDDTYTPTLIHASEIGQRLGGKPLGTVLPLPPTVPDHAVRHSLVNLAELGLTSHRHNRSQGKDPLNTQLIGILGTIDNWPEEEWSYRVSKGQTIGWPCWLQIDLHANGMATLNADIGTYKGILSPHRHESVLHPYYDHWQEWKLDEVAELQDFTTHYIYSEQLGTAQLNALAGYIINHM